MITTVYGALGNEVYKKPSFIQPAYSINGATTQSDKTGEPNHRFLFDVYVNDEKVARVKSLASYLNYASVEISDILKNYVESEYAHATPRPSPDDERATITQLYIVNSSYLTLKSVKILAGEEYKVNGVLTIFNGLDVEGDPEVYVSSWYSTYHAMDASSEEVLRATGDISNVQFSSNHLDVLERVNKGMMNTAGYDGSSNYYKTLPTSQYNILYVNDNIKELSHRPLNRLRFDDIPQSASFYETNYITLWNKKGDNNDDNPANYDRATIGRNFSNPDEVIEPFGRIEPYNNYRQRIQTIGYEFYDPSGLLVDEVRFQPNSPIFDQPIYDTFGFDYDVVGDGRFTGQGEGISESNQRKVETGWEYVKYDTFKEGSRVNITSQLADGDFTNISLDTIQSHFSGEVTGIESRPNVKYMEGDKICEYTPPSLIKTAYQPYQNGNDLLNNFIGFDRTDSFKDIEKLKTHQSATSTQNTKASTFSCYAKGDKNNVAGFLGQFPDPATIGEVGDSGAYSPTQYQGPVSNQVGYWKFTWDFYGLPDRITVIKNGVSIIFDSGIVSGKGVFFYDQEALATDTFQVRIDTYDPGTEWEFYVRVAATPWPHNPPNMIPYLAQGNNFMIVEDTQENTGLIVGLDSTLPEDYNGPYTKYEFNLATGLRVYNIAEDRNATYEEIKSLTGRSIEGVNYTGVNGRSVIEVLTAKTIGQNVSTESGDDLEKLLITFQINPVATTSSMDEFLIFPGVYTGVNRMRDWNDQNDSPNTYYFGTKMDRFRIMNGNDKSLKSANQMKLKIYDFDNNFNLLKEGAGNAGKFITNVDGWSGGGVSNNGFLGLTHTTLTDTQYMTYGVNGNKWDINTAEGYGYLGDFQNQQKVGRGNMRNVPATPTTGHIILQSAFQSYNQGLPAWWLSYMLSGNEEKLFGPNNFVAQAITQSKSGKMFIHLSMMILVKDNPEPAVTASPTYFYLSNPGPNQSVPTPIKRNFYRPEDKGRWKRMYVIQEVPATDQDAGWNYQSRVQLLCDLQSNTDGQVWDMKDLIFGDVRVSYLFGQTETDRVIEAHKLYDRNLVQINVNQEPHLTQGADLLRNEAHSLFWMNKFGTWDDYRFRARSTKTTEVKRTTRSTGLDKIGTLDSTYVKGKQEFGDIINYQLVANDIYELTTDYVNQEEREWFENIFTSPKHMMYDELTDAFIRVTLLNKKYTIINKKNQKLFQLKIEVQVSPENRTLQVLGGY